MRTIPNRRNETVFLADRGGRRRRGTWATALLLLGLLVPGVVWGAHYTWLGDGSPQGDADNWTPKPQGAFTAADSFSFPVGSTYGRHHGHIRAVFGAASAVVVEAGAGEVYWGGDVGSLLILSGNVAGGANAGTISISGGTLNLSPSLKARVEHLSLGGGRVLGAGSFTSGSAGFIVSKVFRWRGAEVGTGIELLPSAVIDGKVLGRWSGGALAGSGQDLYVESLDILGDGDKGLKGLTLYTEAVRWSGRGNIQLGNAPVWNNLGVLTLLADAYLGPPGLSGGVLNNFGTVVKTDADGSPDFELDDLLNMEGLANRLKQASDPVSAFVHALLASDTQDKLLKYAGGDDPELAQALVNSLNEVISLRMMYDEQVFRGVPLRQVTQDLVALGPDAPGPILTLRNRLLLEDAYPGLLERTRARTTTSIGMEFRPQTKEAKIQVLSGSLALRQNGQLEDHPREDRVSVAAGSSLQLGGGEFTLGGQFDLGGNLCINSGNTVRIDGDLDCANLFLTYGTLTGTNALTGNIYWDGDMASGETTLRPESTLYIAGLGRHPGRSLSQHRLILEGRTILRDDPYIAFKSASRILNLPQGQVEVQSKATLSADASTDANVFENQGTLRVTNAVLNMFVRFLHSGGLQIDHSQLRMDWGGSLTPFSLGTNSVIELLRGTCDWTGDFDLKGNVIVSGGNVTINGTVETPSFLLTGGSLAGTNTMRGAFTWDGGVLDSGWTTIPPGSEFEIQGGARRMLSTHQLDIAGRGRWDDSGSIGYDGFTGRLNVLPGGIMVINHSTNTVWWGRFTINNHGALLKRGAGTTTFESVPLHSSGELLIEEGTLALAGGGTLQAPVQSTAFGTLALLDGSFHVSGDCRMAGHVVIGSETAKPSVVWSGLLEAASWRLSGGLFSGTNTLLGDLHWDGGYLGAGHFRVDANSHLAIAGSRAKGISTGDQVALLELAGRTVWNSPGSLGGYGSTWRNLPGAEFIVDGDAVLQDCTFVNEGTFRKRGGSGTTVVRGGAFMNAGVLELARGRLSFENGLTLEPTSLCQFTFSGYQPGTEFGQLHVSGSPILTGGLSVALEPGFRPVSGARFDILSAGALRQRFTPTASLDLFADHTLEPLYESNRLALVVTNMLGTVTQSLVQVSSTWKYTDAAHQPGTGWAGLDYDASGWSAGSGVFHVNATPVPEPVGTALSFPPEGPSTFYFRSTFTWPPPDSTNVVALPTTAHLSAGGFLDEGGVIYVNGAEVARLGMPSGPVSPATKATRTVTGPVPEERVAFAITNLIQGENVVAVELHQSDENPADAVFGLTLDAPLARTQEAPYVVRQTEDQTVSVGQPVLLSVRGGGAAPLTYQWYRDGNLLAAEENSTLFFHAATPGQAVYQAYLSNGFGSVTSAPMRVIVVEPVSCQAPANDLVAWWTGEQTGADWEGTNHLTLDPGARFLPGKVGDAFVLDPSQTPPTVPVSSSVALDSTTGWTIEGWIWAEDDAHVGYPTIYSYGNWGATLGLNRGTARLESWVNDSSRLISTGVIVLKRWTHVALVYDGGNATFYIDGLAAGSGRLASVNRGSFPSTVGGVGARGEARFFGLIDELSVYRRALSAQEIAAIHLAGSAGKCQLPLRLVPTWSPTGVLTLEWPANTLLLRARTVEGPWEHVPTARSPWVVPTDDPEAFFRLRRP